MLLSDTEKSIVEEFIDSLIANSEMFTAFEVSDLCCNDKSISGHKKEAVRDYVHALFYGKGFTDYTRESVVFDNGFGQSVSAFVYHENGQNPYSYISHLVREDRETEEDGAPTNSLGPVVSTVYSGSSSNLVNLSNLPIESDDVENPDEDAPDVQGVVDQSHNWPFHDFSHAVSRDESLVLIPLSRDDLKDYFGLKESDLLNFLSPDSAELRVLKEFNRLVVLSPVSEFEPGVNDMGLATFSEGLLRIETTDLLDSGIKSMLLDISSRSNALIIESF
jgi:hypothetical protein